MNTRHLLPVLGILAVVSCQTAPPGVPTPTAASRFAEADTNKDGKISREEMSDHLVNEVFASVDTNKDKVVTVEEWSPNRDPEALKAFKARDTNKDGKLSLEEAKAYARHRKSYDKIFNDADTDKDHGLSLQEVTNYYASKEGPAR